MQNRELGPDVTPTFTEILQDDARKVAKRTLRSKFGRLSNARIVRVLRVAAASDLVMAEASDDELLSLWFDAFEAAREQLKNVQ